MNPLLTSRYHSKIVPLAEHQQKSPKPLTYSSPTPVYITTAPDDSTEIPFVSTNSHDFEEIEILPPSTAKPEFQTVRVTTFAPDEKYRQKVKAVNKKVQNLHELREKPLSEILTKLQKSNHLPETLRPEHVDNSVKTLVKILNNLKQKENVQKPSLELSNHAVDYENYDDGNRVLLPRISAS
jgi:hypothetical protein